MQRSDSSPLFQRQILDDARDTIELRRDYYRDILQKANDD
jgi:hypothetical protein